MSDDKDIQLQYLNEQIKQITANIKELDKKIEAIPLLIQKIELFIGMVKQLQSDLDIVTEHQTEITVLKNQVAALQMLAETVKKQLQDYVEREFKPLRDNLESISRHDTDLAIIKSKLETLQKSFEKRCDDHKKDHENFVDKEFRPLEDKAKKLEGAIIALGVIVPIIDFIITHLMLK